VEVLACRVPFRQVVCSFGCEIALPVQHLRPGRRTFCDLQESKEEDGYLQHGAL
jgi:hypothetical protein